MNKRYIRAYIPFLFVCIIVPIQGKEMYIGNIELDGQFSYQIFIHVTAIRGTFTPRPDVETKYLVNRAVHLWERKEMNAAELVNFTPKPFKVGGTSEHIENLLIITN